MNVKTAATVGGAAFLLSALAGLLGGVPWFDLIVRAIVWGVLGGAAAVGVETLLRRLLPELFEGEAPVGGEGASERAVDIVLDDDPTPRPFIEEIDEGNPVPPPRPEPSSSPRPVPEETLEPAPVSPGSESSDDEMPEIGSFLDAFKPGSDADSEGAGASGESAGFVPQDEGGYEEAPAVTIDGEAQDPALLAKAVRTVLKRDEQGK